ncbi:Nucleotide-rhamnose synthase/epimerase-reductase [Hibiscus syriacus]|uniref:phospholipase D n=1 Tax=Hibiscus syriacus TaxID=106335 RepID=A0A6A3CKY0_HIBSY|nr:Nucleotide-rhamnose synthase/epimerase-reductase [Hibiscus syriacus]
MASPLFHETLSLGGSGHGQGLQILPFKTSKVSLQVLLLHGNLDILVKEAKNLPNMDMFHKKLGDMFEKIDLKFSSKLDSHHKITSDPYVAVSVAGAVIGRTFVISNSENPIWMQHFNVPVAHYASEVHFVVKDDDVVGSQIMGAVGIPVEQLCSATKIERTFPILNGKGEPSKPGAVLTLSVKYTPIQQMAIYSRGLGSGPDHHRVPGTYFPIRKGCKVTLYQDAHVHDGLLPNLEVDGIVGYEHGSCWQDICNAIGDLLKLKSQEGVRVLLLVWDDPTSKSIVGYKTISNSTISFYLKESWVQMMKRLASFSSTLRCRYCFALDRPEKEAGPIYTHHQKTVIVDADSSYNKRKIMAFVGGLDLCKGRYDTPNHSLFRTLQRVHKDDYHNACFTLFVQENLGMICIVELTARLLMTYSPTSRSEDAFLKIERIPEIVWMTENSSKDDPETWHVQVFRSIDSNSVKGFPHNPKDATKMNLACGKNVLIDMSIHTAYVNAIRSAQPFIYVENQYFLGSSYDWDAHKDLGVTTSAPIQRILFLQPVDGVSSLNASDPTASNTPQEPAKKSRRFMIYIHSKGMIVDVECVIIGSSNINQRSMEGTRDTEIAVGAYPPSHSCSNERHNPHGQVYGYRMSLWAEHIGGEQNWKRYIADKMTEMKGHLLKYPVDVNRTDKAKALPGCETFPDVGGKILGSFVASHSRNSHNLNLFIKEIWCLLL